ncbi:MAG TPA: hypothetical protein VJI98_02815 [Candidatus Nanoarchaeia archaeon]|nr:hypothetical protein [Candidatus Nanoarchaeia archaeon]
MVTLPMTPFFDSGKVFKDDQSALEAFCKKFGVDLIGVAVDDEVVPPNGLIYMFTDDLGGYSREGLNSSLGVLTLKTGGRRWL